MKVLRILETALYVRDLVEAKSFYSKIPGIEFMSEVPERHVFFRCGDTILLLFNAKQTSKNPGKINGSIVPCHGADGVGHIAFEIDGIEFKQFKKFLTKNGITIESEQRECSP